MPHDEVAFITGAGSGIGAATAVELSGRGAKVGLFDLDEAGLHRTEAEIAAAGGRAVALGGDVADDRSVEAGVTRTVSQFGPLTTAVSCAGIITFGTVVDTTMDDWNREIAINLHRCVRRRPEHRAAPRPLAGRILCRQL